jgi:TolB-like protein/DNA-binding winged helix-turn-helix (wHTH) protein/cytochrome c-type biogenesis protein CcmH/NrfG
LIGVRLCGLPQAAPPKDGLESSAGSQQAFVGGSKLLNASQNGSKNGMNPQTPHLIYEFGDFQLDALRRVLVSRADGQQVEVTGRVLEALVFLVERPGRLVDKKELIEALWPHVVVEEGSLTQTIHTLRRALGERPGEHRYIATVPGRGYRFVAEVSIRAAQAKSDPAPVHRSRSVLAGTALAIAILTVLVVLLLRGRGQPAEEVSAHVAPSIAVLPFVDMSTEQDQEHFAEGLSEEILNLLAHSDALRVIARTSSFSFKGQEADVRTIAQRLTVTHVLEGSVRKSGERVRITAQLIDGATGAHVWSETYDRDVQDVFGVQREIASAVANALQVTLHSGDGPKRAETSSTQAYESYLQGRHLFNRRSGSDLQQAKTHFEDAVRIDPGYARAWAALAGVYFVAHYEGPELPDAASKWREAAQRAVALAPDLAEANIRAAQYYWLAGDIDAARMHNARAIALDPADLLVISLSLADAITEGRMEDAVDVQRRMVTTDPLNATERSNLGVLLMMTGHLDEAQVELERSLELSPASVSKRRDIADLLILQRRTDEALKAIQQLPAGRDRDVRLALAYFARGDDVEGDVILARLLGLGAAPGVDSQVPLDIAGVYAIKNDPDQAFKWLDFARRRSVSEGTPTECKELVWALQTATFLEPLHADPRWKELLAAIDAE